ncbi:hypothetical protein HOLleu_11156 [Holothuria leucospilota]|uniref:HAT C-terminal dimerisation domain-containing protein n=1 Tax=Holothuria leucospilota TaxID=206669 RepID=A0A9Q1CF94_HOLLE|nr:hypothetical protein HOLleu_11156 [Holothuria leucospilota]
MSLLNFFSKKDRPKVSEARDEDTPEADAADDRPIIIDEETPSDLPPAAPSGATLPARRHMGPHREPSDASTAGTSDAKRLCRQHRRKSGFDDAWLAKYKWLEYREGLGMFCKLCTRHGQHAKGTKSWTMIASTSYREDRLRNHNQSTHHLVAVGLEGQREAAKKSGGIEGAMAKALTLQETAFLGGMRCMYWLLKQDVAYTTKYKSLLSLVKDLGCTYLEALNIDNVSNYTSERTMQEMAIKESPVFSVLIDESTDITTTEQMLIYIKYLDQNGNTNVTFLGTEELSPMIVSCHCVAHRLALAMSDAGKRIPYVKKFNDLLQMLYQYYDASTVRTGGLRTIQESLEDPVLKPKRALTTRWLSHDHACSTMRQIITSVIISLGREAAEKDNPKAIGLLKLASQWKFVATLHMMCDILPKLSELPRRFQERSGIHTSMRSWLTPLNSFKLALLFLAFTRMRDDVMGRMNAAGIELKNPIDADDFKLNVHDAFITAVIYNIEERFPQTDLMDCFKIFDCDIERADATLPQSLRETEEGNYGEAELEVILDHYENGLGLSREEATVEWHSLRANMVQHPGRYGKLPDALNLVSKSQAYPNLSKVAAAALIIPASTADCERGFSKLKIIKTRLRSRMSHKTLNSLMASIEGPTVQEFQYAKACSLWNGIRNRKITLNFDQLLTVPDVIEDEGEEELAATS